MKKQLKRNKKQRFLNWINLKYVTVIMLTIILTTLARDFSDKYILQVPIEWKGFTRERFVSPIPSSSDSKRVIELNTEPGIKNVSPTMTPTPTPKKRALKIDVVRDVEASELTSDQEIIAYIQSKDWDDTVAVALAKSENFWNYNKSFNCSRTGGLNKNGTRDHGLWQINDIHINSGAITLEDANDCFKATDFAYGLYKGRGGNFSAWSAYLNKSYLNHL